MNYTREQAEAVKQIVKDFMQHHDICINSYKWDDFLNAKFPTIEVGKWYKYKEYSDCSNPIHDKIEALERELAELKQLINK
jgi:hypothetical protein